MERADMEKIVNYCEEEIRENIDKYRILYEDETIGALPADPSDMLAGYTEALQNLDPEVVEKAFGLIADAYFVTVKD